MIEKFRLQNFKNHGDTCIHLGQLTALVGPNSSGKTSILQALDLLHQLSRERKCNQVFLQGSETDPNTLVLSGAHHLTIHVSGHEEETNWNADVVFSKNKNDRNNHWKPEISWIWNNKGDKVDKWDSIPFLKSAGKIPAILRRTVFLKAIGENLSAPSYTEEIPPRLTSDGTNLASVITYLRTTEPERLERLESHLKEVVPDVQGIRTRPTMISQRELRKLKIENSQVSIPEERKLRADELLFDMTGAKGIPASAVSEGTLIATGLLAALLGTEEKEPRLLLIDDIEQGLHPKAQRDLVTALRKILDTRPDLQILFTTHSPYIVDELNAQETWLLNTDQEGIVHTKRLSEHPDADRALDVLTTGEFWSAEGEEWITENA